MFYKQLAEKTDVAVRAADSLRTSTKREPRTGKDRARQEAIIIP